MTLDPAKLRAVAAGFPGRFFYDAERGDLAFIAKECDEGQCDCEQKLNSDGDQDCSVCIGDIDHGENTGSPIAAMLNAVPALLDECERLRKLCEHACKVGDGLVDLAAPGLDTFRDDAITDIAEIRGELGQ